MPSIREVLTLIKNAILAESEQGQKWKELCQKQADTIAKLRETVSALQEELKATKKDDVKVLLQELDDTSMELQGILDLIPSINPTPVTDALTNEVISNSAINTPGGIVGYETGTSEPASANVVASVVEAIGNSVNEPLTTNVDAGETIPSVPATPMPTPPQLTEGTHTETSGTSQISDPNIEVPNTGEITVTEG